MKVKMKLGQLWETSDGSTFTNEDNATIHQSELNAKHELAFLVQDNTVTQNEEDAVFDFIWEYRYHLRDILNLIKEGN